MPAFDHIAAVPRRRLSASAVFFNGRRDLLLVRPTYRDDGLWLLVGGSVDDHESPRAGCRREVREELGLDLPVAQLLCIEYQPATTRSPQSLHFVFHGGELTEAQLQQIRLPTGELGAFRFCGFDEARTLLGPRVGARLGVALTALDQRRTIYLEDGVEVAGWP